MMEQHLRDLAAGRWPSIMLAFGLPSKMLTGKHMACPLCGGHDRFRFDDHQGRGTYYCGQCGSGDGFNLLVKFTGKPFRDVAQKIKATLGECQTPPCIPQPPDEAAQWNAICRVWEGARKPEADSPVGRYLKNRLGRPWPLRGVRETHHPSMVWPIQDEKGNLVNLHITRITPKGEKASGDKVRLYMPGSLPAGSAVRIWRAGPVMGIAEGIETAMAAMVLERIPVWAATNSNLLAKWNPPEGTETVIVISDNDANYAGQAAAYQLANRLVIQRKIRVEVRVPGKTDTDFLDVLRNRDSMAAQGQNPTDF